MKRFIISTLCVMLVALVHAERKYDVVVYGSTSAGITAAIQVARMGKNVLLISQTKHLGGVTSSGLGATDINQRAPIGGLSREFYQRIYQYYENPKVWRNGKDWAYYAEQLGKHFWKGKDDKLKMQWMFEPHVARKVYDEMLMEAGVKIVFNERLIWKTGVVKKNNAIVKIKMESGAEYEAKVFIDATYEGDLMAQSGVKYIVGREKNSQYNETMNGILPGKNAHKSRNKIDPYLKEGDPASGLLPFIEPKVPGIKGEGDHRLQAYCYRFTLSKDPKNKRPIEKPGNYNPLWFEHIYRWIKANPNITINSILTLTPLPNDKTDTNHADFVGANYAWPEGDYKMRDSLAQMHKDYLLGEMWFLANDERIPARIKKGMQKWGLAKDEFIDNDNLPYQIYVREARRMVSDYVMSENEVLGKKIAPESVGLATYWFDSHVVCRYVDENGGLCDEGNFWSVENIYPVSYRSIRPKADECTNLLVPVCISSSHAAYGSIRMEPVYMVLGQSAAVAAVLAIEAKTTVQEVTYAKLKKKLIENKQIVDWQVKRKEINKKGEQ